MSVLIACVLGFLWGCAWTTLIHTWRNVTRTQRDIAQALDVARPLGPEDEARWGAR